MFKGLKHTVGCKCGETTIPCEDFDAVDKIEASNQISECCKSKFTYIGLQPFYESILAVPIRKADPNLKEVVVEEPVVEEVDGTPTIVEEKTEQIEAPKIIVAPPEFVPEAIKEQIKKVEIPNAPLSEGGIPGLIEAGPKGFVTNTQMIPVLKDLIDTNQMDKVTILKNTYPDVYEKSIKYLPKKYQDKLK